MERIDLIFLGGRAAVVEHVSIILIVLPGADRLSLRVVYAERDLISCPGLFGRQIDRRSFWGSKPSGSEGQR
jgi:hypothetical protein